MKRSVVSLPGPVVGNLRAMAVAVGELHVCAIAADSTAWCWGDNESGQLGVDSTGACEEMDGSQTPCSRAPVKVRTAVRFVVITVGLSHSCALDADGRAWCWGEARLLGSGAGESGGRTQPAPVAGGRAFVSLTAGKGHTCGLTAAGEAYCWGDDNAGQLGDGIGGPARGPVRVALAQPLRALAAGDRTTCALGAGGDAWCWGANERGQLGRGSTDTVSHPVPARVRSTVPFESLSAGGYQVCGLTRRGGAWCWGAPYWMLGGPVPVPWPVDVAAPLVSLSVGGPYVCGPDAAGATWCWGRLDVVGIDPDEEDDSAGVAQAARPARLAGTYRSISAGRYTVCGLSAAGRVHCWGDDYMGQLGLRR